MTPMRRVLIAVLGLIVALPLLTGDFKNVRRFVGDLFGGGPAVADIKPGPMDAITLVSATGPHRFSIELAADDDKRAEGLMFRKSMADDHGMLFDFKREQVATFWMKNTYIPLDMIFIGSDGNVAHIAENTTPLSEATVSSGVPVRFVLEVNGGIARRIGLKSGDRAIHLLMRPKTD